MKTSLLFSLSLLFAHFTFGQSSEQYAGNEILLQFKKEINFHVQSTDATPSFGHPLVDALNTEFSVEKIKSIGGKKEKRTFMVRFENDQDIPAIVQRYQTTNLFEYVEPNFIGTGAGVQGQPETTPNDPFFNRQYGLHNDGTFALSTATTDADIDMDLAWDIEQGDPSIIVAILDSGLRLNHPEFNGRIWTNSGEVNDGNDTDNNGYQSDLNGWDFANDDNNPTDDHGHGTNVTGILGANGNNSIGYAGVDWNCKLMVGKILDDNNSGFYSWWVEAIYYAVDNGAKAINMSVGGSGFSGAMQDAVNYAYNNGVTIVACMMNFNNSTPYYPAAYLNTIAVGSTDANDERTAPFFWSSTSGSNYGSHIDLIAPGNYIYGLSYQSNSNYNTYWGGTSQATPLVTGIASLLLAQNNNRTLDDIRSIVTSTAEDLVGSTLEDQPGFDIYYGHGRLNAFAALSGAPLSTSETVFDANITIAPNPANERMAIDDVSTFSTIQIYNTIGELVAEQSNPQKQVKLQFDTSNFEVGLYIVTCLDEKNNRKHSVKLVINR